MQKNKFIHEDIKAVCNRAVKKLIAIGAIGITVSASALTASAYYDTKEDVEEMVQKINEEVAFVESHFSREKIEEFIPASKKLEKWWPFATFPYVAWEGMVQNMNLDKVLNEPTEVSVHRLLDLMDPDHRAIAERCMAEGDRSSYASLWCVLRDYWNLVEQPLYSAHPIFGLHNQAVERARKREEEWLTHYATCDAEELSMTWEAEAQVGHIKSAEA